MFNSSGSMTNEIYETIKESLMYGGIPSGQILNEGILAKQYNVSKTPVREALQRLVHEGLLMQIAYKGYLVRELSLQDFVQIFQLRSILESSAAELAAKKITPEQVVELQRIAKFDCSGDMADIRIRFMKKNTEFHSGIAQVSGNNRLVEAIEHLHNQLQRDLFVDIRTSGIKGMVEEHLELVEVLHKGDPDQARQIMAQQIENSFQRIYQIHVGS